MSQQMLYRTTYIARVNILKLGPFQADRLGSPVSFFLGRSDHLLPSIERRMSDRHVFIDTHWDRIYQKDCSGFVPHLSGRSDYSKQTSSPFAANLPIEEIGLCQCSLYISKADTDPSSTCSMGRREAAATPPPSHNSFLNC